MPRTLRYNNHILIQGQGLDEILEPERGILVVDDFYGDIYGDYIFLGYDVYVTVPNVERGDLVSLVEAAVILDKGPMIVVCGNEPERCLYVIATHAALHGEEPGRALEEAAGELAKLYDRPPRLRKPPMYAVHAAYRLGKLLGIERLSPIIGLGDSYNYGWGSIHYGETNAWLAAMEASDVALLAGALHFLTEGPGEPAHLLRLRLEAVGEKALHELLGGYTQEVVKTLQAFAEGRPEGAAAELLLAETLGPGSGDVDYVERNNRELRVACPTGDQGEPLPSCVERVGKAAKLVEEKRPMGLESVRIVPAER